MLRDRDLIARLGGDEFAVLLPGLGSLKAQEVADRLRDSLAAGFHIAGIDLDVDASIGIATLASHEAPAGFPVENDGAADGSPNIEDLLRRADVAMYAAKQSGCGVVAYAPQQDENTRARLTRLFHVVV